MVYRSFFPEPFYLSSTSWILLNIDIFSVSIFNTVFNARVMIFKTIYIIRQIQSFHGIFLNLWKPLVTVHSVLISSPSLSVPRVPQKFIFLMFTTNFFFSMEMFLDVSLNLALRQLHITLITGISNLVMLTLNVIMKILSAQCLNSALITRIWDLSMFLCLDF